jgi:hypothetical protein
VLARGSRALKAPLNGAMVQFAPPGRGGRLGRMPMIPGPGSARLSLPRPAAPTVVSKAQAPQAPGPPPGLAERAGPPPSHEAPPFQRPGRRPGSGLQAPGHWQSESTPGGPGRPAGGQAPPLAASAARHWQLTLSLARTGTGSCQCRGGRRQVDSDSDSELERPAGVTQSLHAAWAGRPSPPSSSSSSGAPRPGNLRPGGRAAPSRLGGQGGPGLGPGTLPTST